MKTRSLVIALVPAALGAAALLVAARAVTPPTPPSPPTPPPVATPVPTAAYGRHLIMISGCNDCHTPGFMENPKVDESLWLTGVPVGWHGPWGTTYASNLRRHAAAFADAEIWVQMVRGRQGLPPMPWPSLHAMTDHELRSIHAYLRSLPLKGEVMPPPLPPGQTPTTPYLNMMPVVPDTAVRSLE